MEGAPKTILTAAERSMYQKFMQDPSHEGWSESDFKEFREFALSGHRSGGMKNFFALNGIVMEESELPSAEDIKDGFN